MITLVSFLLKPIPMSPREQQYQRIYDYLYQAPVEIVDPLGPTWLPEEDPEWASPDHTQQVMLLLKRLSHASALVCAATALEMTLPEWLELSAEPPFISEEISEEFDWPTLYPRSLEAIWVDGHMNYEITPNQIISLERQGHITQEFFAQVGESIEQGSIRSRYIPPAYERVTLPILGRMNEHYESREFYRIADLLLACKELLYGALGSPSWPSNLALSVTYCLEHDRARLEYWWKLCRRRLAMRDA